MKKPDKREIINLFFSAFLIIAFIVCAHFFSEFSATLPGVWGSVISIALYVIFGLLLFYSTRVGEGKAIKRFSIVTLLVMVVPAIYIIVASLAPGLPLYNVFAAKSGSVSVIVILASIALGYGIPYTFLSGFEVAADDNAPSDAPLSGGIEEDLLTSSADDSAEENLEDDDDDGDVDSDSADDETEV